MSTIQIQHVFFDLDRTLWDFEKNSGNTLLHLFETYNLKSFGFTDFEQFHTLYKAKNDICWELYRENRMTKESMRSKRFKMTLQEVGYDSNTLAKTLGEEYVALSPVQTTLIEGTHEILDYLSEKYRLHIITNGFEEIQSIKLKACKIDHYFEQVITSERAGFKKPQEGIFRFACHLSKARPFESVMIGDDLEIDALGAERFGMKGIHFNPTALEPNIPNEISKLEQLKTIL